MSENKTKINWYIRLMENFLQRFINKDIKLDFFLHFINEEC